MKYYKKIQSDGRIELLQDPIVKNHTGLIELTKEEFDAQLELNNTPTDEQILESKVNEALAYLSSTDKKVLPYYDFEEGDDSLEHYIEARRIARQFVRDNQNAWNIFK